MAEVSFFDRIKELDKGEIAPIYYLVGQEDYFHDRFIQKITQVIFPDRAARDLNLTVLYGTEDTLQQVLSAAASFPMMADRRLVIVRSFNKMSIGDPEVLSKYLQHPQKTTCLILSASEDGKARIYREIREKAVLVPCKPIREYQIAGWLVDLAKSKNIELSPEAAQMMADHLGPHLLALEKELDKLRDFKGEGVRITLQDVAEVTGTSGADIFALQKALAVRDLNKSLSISKRLLESGTDLININAVLFAYFKKALIAASLKKRRRTQDEIGRELKMAPFQLKQTMMAVNNFDYKKLKEIIKLLSELDIQSKTSSVSPAAALQMLCFKICRL